MSASVGIVHPGRMGISVAATLQHSGQRVLWTSEGRSAATRARAEQHRLVDAGSLAELSARSDVIVSVCPPAAAEEVAHAVIGYGFKGLFLEANAISPQRTRAIEAIVTDGGARYVDGGIVGGPAWQPGRTWLYLSGPDAAEAAALFAAGPLETETVGEEIGRASALKMCYAAYTKGTSALLSAVLAAAHAYDVDDALARQWERDWPGFAGQTEERVRRVTAKAWRFAGEMEEIAATFDVAGVPDGFHRAAAELYARTAEFKDALEPPPLADVVAAILRP